MKYFMLKFAYENKGVDKGAAFRMGMVTALLSAVMYSAFYLADMLYITPEYYDQIIQESIKMLTPLMDSNQMTAFEKTSGMMPQITFLTNLGYCFGFGTLLSLILSRKINPTDSHTEYNQ